MVTGRDSYASVLARLPDVLAWGEAGATLDSLGELQHSVCWRRLRSALNFIGSYDHSLARKMEEALAALSSNGLSRFITAPQTYMCISRLQKEPAKSVMALSEYLNAELVRDGTTAQGARGYWTALGDFYSRKTSNGTPDAALSVIDKDAVYQAPRIGEIVPVDFFSPNVAWAKQTTISSLADYLEFTPADREIVVNRLDESLGRIADTSEAAAQLIKRFTKVIIPIRVAQGAGSNSKRSSPGRVMMRGVENADSAIVASCLVHESIHQFLYVLEFAGRFVLNEPLGGVVSYWTGRKLPLDSFIHACFVWYGLANFWMQARTRNTFPEDIANRELTKCLAGFRGCNPLDAVTPYVGMLRYDVWKVACTLQERLATFERAAEGGGHAIQ